MAEKPDQIEHDIEAEREQLTKNLEQLETKIKRATDWREVVGRYPVAALGAAFGVGFVISVLTGSRQEPELWPDGATRRRPLRDDFVSVPYSVRPHSR